MQFWVYILRCSDGSYYTGHTDNIDVRLAQHQRGEGGDWTSRRRPVELVWCDIMPTRIEGIEAERRIKPWSRAKKEALMAKDWARLSHFARPPGERPSTSLGTNEVGEESSEIPFVPCEVEGREPTRTNSEGGIR
jgi:predicted GIY-YIG superfamily endonuclease